jgi:hypothetical protein
MRVLDRRRRLTFVESAYVRSIAPPTVISAMVRTHYSIAYEPMAVFGSLQPITNDPAYG